MLFLIEKFKSTTVQQLVTRLLGKPALPSQGKRVATWDFLGKQRGAAQRLDFGVIIPVLALT